MCFVDICVEAVFSRQVADPASVALRHPAACADVPGSLTAAINDRRA